jgi:hypothetical protein
VVEDFEEDEEPLKAAIEPERRPRRVKAWQVKG